MQIPWQDIKVPKRYITVNKKMTEKFPILWKLFEYGADDIIAVQKRFNKLLIKNILEIGLTEDMKLEFNFRVGENFLPQKLMYFVKPILRKKPLKDFIGGKYTLNTVKPEDEANVFEFFQKLNSKIGTRYQPYQNQINEIVQNSELAKFLKQFPNIIRMYKLQHSEIIKYAPEIEFVQDEDFYSNSRILRFYFTGSINILSGEIRHELDENKDLNDSEREKYKEQVSNWCDEMERKITKLLENIKESDILDLSEL